MGRLRIAILLVVVLLPANMLVSCGPAEGTAEWHFKQGIKCFDQGKYSAAIEAYTETIRLDPEYAPAFNNRGYAYVRLRQYEQAIKDYDEAIRLNPEFATAYTNRGFTYKELGKKDKAIADFEKYVTITKNPESIEMVKQEIAELSQ